MPPVWGADGGENVHWIPLTANSVFSFSFHLLTSFLNSRSPARKLVPLSLMRWRRPDRRAWKRERARMKECTSRPSVTLQCTALVAAQVNRQTYRLGRERPLNLTWYGPQKSTPVWQKTWDAVTRKLGSGAISCCRMAPLSQRHLRHFQRKLRTAAPSWIIQTDCCKFARVCCIPTWPWIWWWCWISRGTMRWSRGRMMGWLDEFFFHLHGGGFGHWGEVMVGFCFLHLAKERERQFSTAWWLFSPFQLNQTQREISLFEWLRK